jgi:hypothetical protein
MEIVTDELSIYTDVSMFRSGRTLTIHQEYYIHTQGSIRMGPVGFAADTYILVIQTTIYFSLSLMLCYGATVPFRWLRDYMHIACRYKQLCTCLPLYIYIKSGLVTVTRPASYTVPIEKRTGLPNSWPWPVDLHSGIIHFLFFKGLQINGWLLEQPERVHPSFFFSFWQPHTRLFTGCIV